MKMLQPLVPAAMSSDIRPHKKKEAIMKRIRFGIPVLALVLPLSVAVATDTVSIVSKETVKGWMDTGPVTILDARSGRDWTASEFKITTAHRVDPGNLNAWKDDYPKDSRLVIYCA